MENDSAVNEAVQESEKKAITRIRKREQRGERGPWKWQLIDRLDKAIELLEGIETAITALSNRLDRVVVSSETQRKLSEAGKKSAEARRKKFGSAAPVKVDHAAPGYDRSVAVKLVDGAVAEVTDLLGEPVREPVRRKKPAPPPTEGVVVWLAYHQAYVDRWKVEPIRNEKTNTQCKQLAKLAGVDQARELVRYYVSRSDAFYVNAKHPIGLLLIDLQKLRTEMLQGREMTLSDAKRYEVHARTDSAIQQYARQQGIE